MKKNKNDINLAEDRFGLFLTQESINLEIAYGQHYLNSDSIHFINLYRINIIETKSHQLYGQAKPQDRKYLLPIKLRVMPKIEDSKQENYGGNPSGLARDDTGNLVFGIYLKELEENDTEINRGDIVEYNISGNKNRYYEVENANLVNDETNKTIGGFVPYFKRITAVPVKEDVVGILFK